MSHCAFGEVAEIITSFWMTLAEQRTQYLHLMISRPYLQYAIKRSETMSILDAQPSRVMQAVGVKNSVRLSRADEYMRRRIYLQNISNMNLCVKWRTVFYIDCRSKICQRHENKRIVFQVKSCTHRYFIDTCTMCQSQDTERKLGVRREGKKRGNTFINDTDCSRARIPCRWWKCFLFSSTLFFPISDQVLHIYLNKKPYNYSLCTIHVFLYMTFVTSHVCIN